MLYTACMQQNGYPGGFFRSTDHGNTWRFLGSFRPNYFINSLLGVTDNILLANFASNNEYFGSDFDTLGIYRSDDSGKTWKLVLTGDAAAFGNATLVGIGGGNIIVKADSDYRSTDSGLTWKRFSPSFLPDYEIFVPVPAGVLSYNNSALYLSKDFQTWNVVPTPKPMDSSHGLLPLPSGDLALFSDSLYLSSNYGISWTSRSVNYKTEYGIVGPLCFLSDGCLIGNVSDVDPYRSSDSGKTWTRINDVS
ncbi:MAG TPA: sialidase family protein, partial [Candidatus Kapabacteria bacterium]|nr:sialidase family protein [Candidatus Kapabacteria bacterium]